MNRPFIRTVLCAVAVCCFGFLPWANAVEYFVNDAYTNGDVYTFQAGSDECHGTNAHCPKATIQGILDKHMLLPGDIIYVDTGYYTLTNSITWPSTHSGAAGNYLVVQGSTNYEFGGTVLSRASDAIVTVMGGAEYVWFADLQTRGGEEGFYLNPGVHYCVFENVYVGKATAHGVFINSSCQDNLLLHSTIAQGVKYGVWNQGTGTRIVNCVVAENGYDQVYLLNGSSLDMCNSLLVAGVSNHYGINQNAGAVYTGNFNNHQSTNRALVGKFGSTLCASLLEWQQASAQDTNSLCHDPLFARTTSNDYRLRSVTGRYQPGVGWTNDSSHSPCIDMGDPDSDWTGEPMPNGGRVNQGAYGGTTYASMSRTNEWLLAVSLNDGGTVRDEVLLRWRSGLFNPMDPVRLDYARDESNGWQQIVSGLAAGDEQYLWSATNVLGSPFARWRIVSENDTNLWDATDRTFELRPFVFYVNDSDTAGDQYCSEPGNDRNLGVASNAPKATVQSVITNYDLEWGDRVYIDNGRYTLTNRIEIGVADRGSAQGCVVFQGGTNSVFACPAVSEGLWLNLTAYIDVSDLVFTGGTIGVRINSSSNCLLQRVSVQGSSVEGLHLNTAYNNRLSAVRVLNTKGHGFYINISSGNIIEHAVIASCAGNGLYVKNSSLTSLTNCVLTLNRSDQIVLDSPAGSLHLRNSIVTATEQTQVCVRIVSGGYVGNYNDYHTTGGAYVGYRNGILARLIDWQADLGQDIYSLCQDPLFANPAAGDFHLKSVEGRYVRDGIWTNDPVHSPCIDAGDPLCLFTNEPMERGPRINIGAYGDTAEASKSQTNAWISVVSFNDGGTARGVVNLIWNTGFVTSETVDLAYSTNGGLTWTTIAAVPAAAGIYAWDTTGISNEPAVLWRAVLAPPGVTSVVERIFAINPLEYFVNDAFTNGDVYCAAPGSISNWGLQASSPMLSLKTLLEVHKVDPGSTIYVDTGRYALSNTVEITAADSGNSNGWICLQGSTNYRAGGSVLERRDKTTLSYALQVNGATNLRISDLVVTGGYHGIYLMSADGVTLSKVEARHAAQIGINVANSPRTLIEQARVWNNASYGIKVDKHTNTIRNCSIVQNNGHQIFMAVGQLNMTNTILVCGVTNAYALYLGGGVYQGDYNDILATNGAFVGYRAGARRSLSDWQLATGQDSNSLAHDPLFADAANGDFHLMSLTGRYVRASETWVADPVHSPCIDTGDPASEYDRERVPNGQRVNIGAFGNTWEASLSTNEWLLAVSYNDGGTARGDVPLLWESRLEDPMATVRLDYSADNGTTWINIATNLPATDEAYLWPSTNFHGSPLARWRVVYEDNTSVWDRVDYPFHLRPFRLYVNDPFTDGDVFTSMPGNDNYTGVLSNAPKATVRAILDAYDLDYGDQVFIDTGHYASETPIPVAAADSGSSNGWVTFRGTTNGTVLQCVASNVAAYAVYFNGSEYVEFVDLTVFGGYYGLFASDARYLQFSNVTIHSAVNRGVQIQGGRGHYFKEVETRGCGSDGLYLSTSIGNRFERCLVWSNAGYGCYLSGTSNALQNCVVAFNGSDQIRFHSGPVYLHNNIVVADRIGQHGIYRAAGEVVSDHNNWYTTEGAFVGYYAGVRARLSDWQSGSGQDTNSMARDPRFADPCAGDFHLRSVTGRFDAAVHSWTNDADHSYCIDAGDPLDSYGNEPAPNGARINQGAFGNTPRASMSRTDAWVRVLNYADGGVARNIAELRWTFGNLTGSETVDVYYSLDDGATWTLLGSASVGTGLINWDTSSLIDCPDARWRVELASDPSVTDQSDRPFAVNPFSYFINDTNTTGDVFCGAIGDDRNDGVSSNRPMLSLQRLLDVHDLEPDATVYVDTGRYEPDDDIVISGGDSGATNQPVRITGSFNVTNGGAVFARSRDLSSQSVLHVIGADYVLLERMTVTGAHHGVFLQSASYCALSNITVRGTLVNSILLQDADYARLQELDVGRGDGAGIGLSMSDHLQLERSRIWRHGGRGLYLSGLSNRIEQCAIALNDDDQILLAGGTVSFRHNIVVAANSNDYCFNISSGTYAGDYNNFFTTNGALVGLYGDNRPSLSDWRARAGADTNSLSHDPLFADPDNGDFHLRSVQGRLLPDGSWTNDVVQSPCIDAGDPAADWSLEPVPNGGRINMGPYGGTAGASMSDTNDWLLAVTYNDGGTARKTVDLRWRSGLNDPAATVDIEYSPDDGLTWIALTNDLPAGQGVWEWNTTHYVGSPFALWRVVSTGCVDQIDRTFQVRPFRLFINDAFMAGDIYCTTNGSDTHTGASSNSPMLSLSRLLNAFDLEYDDTVYVDTGVYPLTNDVVILPADGGGTNGYVYVIGSTNRAFGGSLFNRVGGGIEARGFHLNGSSYLYLRHLDFAEGEYGIDLYYAHQCVLEDIRISAAGKSGIRVDGCSRATIRNARIVDGAADGLHARSIQNMLLLSNLAVCANAGRGLRLENSPVTVVNCTVAENRGDQVHLSGGTSTKTAMRNSILSATNTGVYALNIQSGTYTGDYNNLYAVGGAYVVYDNGPRWSLLDWQLHSGMDAHSLSHNPLFVDSSTGNYHLASAPGACSPSVDAGDPGDVWTNEPSPNGSRINQGAYGNTPEAALSDPNPWILAVSCNQGGVARNEVDLRWNSNLGAGDALRLDYSDDDGVTWSTVASGVSPAQESYRWATTNRSPTACWRVVLESDTNVWDRTDGPFILNPDRFYVNDDSTAEDVYTTGPGIDTNRGASVSTPMRTLQNLLAVNDIEPGDTIYVDTGLYLYSNNLTIGPEDAGSSNRAVFIQGSTNRYGQRTVLDRASRNSGAIGLTLNTAGSVNLSHLRLTNGYYGYYVFSASGCSISNCEATGQGWAGIYFRNAHRSTLAHSRIWGGQRDGLVSAGQSNRAFHCVMYGNAASQVRVESGGLSLSNSIVSALSSNAECVRVTTGFYEGDRNDLHTAPHAKAGYWMGERAGLLDWQDYSGQDANSLSHDPLFVDPAGGDFHLRSVMPNGSFSIAAQTWTNFGEHSPCIDAGPPMGAVTNEPDPNGGRLNLGAYGDTVEASHSLTSAWVLAMSLNDGGTARGVVPLRWNWGGIPDGAPVTIEFSRNAGFEWMELTNGRPVEMGVYYWDSSGAMGSPLALWRARVGGVTDAVDRTFYMKPFALYVNDAATSNDLYCSAPGDLANDGVASNSPALRLADLLARYNLEAQDVIYVDTGVYIYNSNTVFTTAHGGSTQGYVVVQGSTNGSVMVRGSASADDHVILFDQAHYVRLANLDLEGGYYGCFLRMAKHNTLSNVAIRGAANVGLYLLSSDYNEAIRSSIHNCQAGAWVAGSGNSLQNSLVWSNTAYGVHLEGQTTNRVINCTIAYNGRPGIDNAYQVEFNNNGYAWNNILAAAGSNVSCYGASTVYAQYSGDYNDLFAMSGARIAEGFNTLVEWRAATGQELHSLSRDPHFVGGDDFHLQSMAPNGTFVKATGLWTSFPTNSCGIDTADIDASNGNEPEPNGDLLNMGAYGNTEEASRSMDTDGEGLSDTFEIYQFGTSITNRDTDGDGMTDYDEFVAATDPLNPIQCFETIGLYPIDPVTGGLILRWYSSLNRYYSIHSTTNLMIPFSAVVTNIPGLPPINTYTVIVINASQTYLRLEVDR